MALARAPDDLLASSVVASRVRFVVGLVLVTIGAGAFAVAFRASLTAVYQTFYGADNIVDSIAGLPRWLRLTVPVAAAAVAGSIARLRSSRTQGVSNVMEAIALGRVQLSLRATASRVASSWVAIAGGLSIGREGPLIEVGGPWVRRWVEPSRHRSTRRASWLARGLRPVSPQPITRRSPQVCSYWRPSRGSPHRSSCSPLWRRPSALRASCAQPSGPVRSTGNAHSASTWYAELLSFALLGIAAAFVALAFKTVLAVLERWFDTHPVPQPYRATLGGLLVGAIAMWLPAVVGNGYEPLNRILDSGIAVSAVIVLVIAKMIATSGSVASGIPGGIFTPMLLVGAALGAGWSHIASFGPVSDAGSYALVGMAAATAASIHAPLTAAIMVFELSGDYLIVLPLILATVVATAASKALGDESVYETELTKTRSGLGDDTRRPTTEGLGATSNQQRPLSAS